MTVHLDISIDHNLLIFSDNTTVNCVNITIDDDEIIEEMQTLTLALQEDNLDVLFKGNATLLIDDNDSMSAVFLVVVVVVVVVVVTSSGGIILTTYLHVVNYPFVLVEELHSDQIPPQKGRYKFPILHGGRNERDYKSSYNYNKYVHLQQIQ